MNNLDTVIDALARAIEMEQALQDYYKRAAQHAKDPHLDDRFHGMQEGHATFAGRIETHREELQRQAGEGAIANAFEAIGDAIYDLLAGLPVAFIHNETTPTIEMLLRQEGQLLDLYKGLRGRSTRRPPRSSPPPPRTWRGTSPS